MLKKKIIYLDDDLQKKIRNSTKNLRGVTENDLIVKAIKEYFFNCELAKVTELLSENVEFFENNKATCIEKYNLANDNLNKVYGILLKASKKCQ